MLTIPFMTWGGLGTQPAWDMMRSLVLQLAEWHSHATRDYLALWGGQWARWEEAVHAIPVAACMQLYSLLSSCVVGPLAQRNI